MQLKVAETLAQIFNQMHPAGTSVIYVNDWGQAFYTATRSEAWVVGGDDHATPIVKLELGTGGYDLTRVVVHRNPKGENLCQEFADQFSAARSDDPDPEGTRA